MGLDAIIAQIVSRMGQVKRVVLVGDYAKGIDSGTIEVVLEGEAIDAEYLAKLVKTAEQEIGKNVSVQITDAFDQEGLLIFEQV